MASNELLKELKQFSDNSISIVEAISYMREANENDLVGELSAFIEEHGGGDKSIGEFLSVFESSFPFSQLGTTFGSEKIAGNQIPPFLLNMISELGFNIGNMDKIVSGFYIKPKPPSKDKD